MPNRPRLKTYTFYGFNVKYLASDSSADRYLEIFRTIFNDRIGIPVSQERVIALKTQFTGSTNNGTVRMLWGQIIRFTSIEGFNWYHSLDRTIINYEIPPNVNPNPFEGFYVFIPEIHRFFVGVSFNISPNSIKAFLSKAVSQVVSRNAFGDLVIVEIIQSQDVIDRILQADRVTRLEVDISYTNDDVGDEAQDFLDNLLKDGKVGRMKAIFNPDESNALNTGNNLVRGAVELAKENGKVTASVVTGGKRQTIRTENYPEKIRVESLTEEGLKTALAQQMFSKYREKQTGESNE